MEWKFTLNCVSWMGVSVSASSGFSCCRPIIPAFPMVIAENIQTRSLLQIFLLQKEKIHC
jgi:hypothetical protein